MKLYVEEEDSTRLRRALASRACTISRLTEVEVPSAFGRAMRSGILSTKDGDRAAAGFRADVERWEVVELTREVVAEAVRLVWGHSLRAADAIQLGSALVFQRAMGQPLGGFVTFDQRLADAARAERLLVLDGGLS